MDEMCNISEAEDLNKTKTKSEETEVLKRSESPVFKCFNIRTNRAGDSSDYDIPSYQINQSQKSRTSSKCENDFVLPFSPICSPIPVNTVQFQPPSIHSLGTVVKNMENVRTKSKATEQANAFQSLGMNDKDISWVSSMASPPPKQLPGSQFNTLEKATFFPEDKFQSIQPRALFSPTSDTDCGCQLISSDSEDNETYKTNIRLSDVCATLKQLEFKSFDSDVKDTAVDFIYSPVIKVKKLESSEKKRKGVLVKSPQDSYDFSVNETKEENMFTEDDLFQSMSFSCLDELCKTVTEQTETEPIKQFFRVKQFYPTKVKDVYKVSSVDGFFSCARTLRESDWSVVGERKLDKSISGKEVIKFDKSNHPKIDGTKRSHSEVSDVKNECVEKKLKVVGSSWENLKEYFSESTLDVSDGEICRTLDNLEKTLAGQEKKEMNLSGRVSQEKNIQKEQSNQCNTYNKIDLKNNSFSCGLLREGFSAGAQVPVSEKFLNPAKQMLKDCDLEIIKQGGFSTVSGKLIQVSNEALERAKALRLECEESFQSDKQKDEHINEENQVFKEALEKEENKVDDKSTKGESFTFWQLKEKPNNVSLEDAEKVSENLSKFSFQGFSTGSGKQIPISDKDLKKAKAFMDDCDREANNKDVEIKALGKVHKPFFQGFQSGSGKLIKVSNEALEKAKAFMEDCCNDLAVGNVKEGRPGVIKQDDKSFSTCSKTSSISAQAFDKTNEKVKDNKSSEKLASVWMGKLANENLGENEALEEAKTLLEDCDETIKAVTTEEQHKTCSEVINQNVPDKLNKPIFEGFQSGSGKLITVSDEALKKAKALMDDCDKETNSKVLEVKKPGKIHKPIFQGFQSGSGKLIKVSDQALQKAKALMEECDEAIKGVRTEEQHKTCSEVINQNVLEKVNKARLQGFQSGSGKLIKVSDEALKKAKALMDDCDKEENSKALETTTLGKVHKPVFQGFQSGSGKLIKVSSEALEKAKAFMEDCNDLPVGNAKEPRPVIKQDDKSFSTRSKTSIQVTAAEALDKTNKKVKDNECPGELASVWMSELANARFVENKAVERGEQTESVTETKKDLGSDAEEIIPSWLHTYNTNPSIAHDRLDVIPLVSEESGNASKPERECAKSPVLGVGDRFYRKVKKRKLDFAEPTMKGTSTSKTKELDFSAPFKKAKLMEMETVSIDVKAERERARKLQEKSINEKEKVKPLRGRLLEKKSTERRMKWVEVVGNSAPESHPEELLRSMGVRENVLRVCIDNAVDFIFTGEDFFGPECQNNGQGILVGDGCLVILDDEDRFGVAELKRAFLASPGIQPNLVAPGWVENHYKWIVWKLAHYEKSFPRHFAGRCLTPNNLMLQLKYRYDREIDRNERSALKKILEKDDTSVKRMVLCVCGIKKVVMGKTSGYELTMTDGWYSCPVRVDAAMSRLIEKGKVLIGTKLQTQGATLVNCEQGISPLEMVGNVYLKISTNSTRRVRWDAKLGFQKNPENFPISLGSILSQGGPISRVDVIIVRVYPILYMEKMPDGYHVTRNRRSEEKAEAEFRKYQEQRMEKMWAEVQSELRQVLEKSKSESGYCEAGEEDELSQLVGGSSDPIVLKKILSQEKRFSKEFSERMEKKLKSEKLEKRNVSEFMRVKVVDFRKTDFNSAAVLHVWNPNEDLLGILSEGKVVSLMNVGMSNSSRGYKNVQLNTSRQTQYRGLNRWVKYPGRKLTLLKDVSSKVCPAFDEVDVVGIVAVIRDVCHGSRLSQVVYLTDLEFHFVGVVFWGSYRDYGWEKVLKIRSIVACSNLQWKKSVNEKEVPSVHVSENSIFTENPRQDYLKEEMSRVKENIPKDMDEFLSKCEEELITRLEDSKWGANRSVDNSKWRRSNEFEARPSASSTPIKPFPVGISSVAFSEPSPIQKRIEKLQNYGEPPPLIPLLVRNRKIRKKI